MNLYARQLVIALVSIFYIQIYLRKCLLGIYLLFFCSEYNILYIWRNYLLYGIYFTLSNITAGK